MEKEKFNWKRHLITTGFVLLTAIAVGGGAWYVMDQQAKKDAEGYQKQISELINQREKSTATTEKESDTTSNWKTYTDKKGVYTIKYPQNWVYDDTYWLGQDFGLTAFGKTQTDLPAKQSDQISAITINTGRGESLSATLKAADKIKVENSKIGGISFTKFTLLPGRSSEEMYGDSKITYYETRVEGKGYLVVIQFADYEEETLQEMLKTFKVQ